MAVRKEEIIKPTLDPEKAKELFKRQIGKINDQLKLQYDDPEVDSWDNFTEQLIIQAFGKPHGNLNAFYNAKHAGPIWMGMPDEALQNNHVKGRENLRKLLEGFIDQLELFNSNRQMEQEKIDTTVSRSSIKSRKIFIVHGHDDKSKTELTLILTKLGFDPIILHEQANVGMTVIEKLEKNSDVGYAFILLTPDDLGKKKGDSSDLPRARQNVVFEFGLFIGKLGRGNVCCLYTGNVELPSDLQGIVYVPFETSVNEVQLDIVKELRAIGYEINL